MVNGKTIDEENCTAKELTTIASNLPYFYEISYTILRKILGKSQENFGKNFTPILEII